MVTNAAKSVQRIFRFLNLPLTLDVQQFLLDHHEDRYVLPSPTTRPALASHTLLRRAWPSLTQWRFPLNATLYKYQLYTNKRYVKRRRKRMESGYTYYSTYKRPNKPFDRWKKKLNQEMRVRLEDACGPVLQEFEYS